MYKLLLIFSVFILSSTNSKAQTFYNSFGISFSLMQGREAPDGPYKNMMVQSSGTYFPRYNLTENMNSSFSIGMPLSLGIGKVNNADGVAFSVDAPLMGDYNFGLLSTPDSESGTGGFLGAGFGYAFTSVSSYFGSGTLSSYGPEVHTGIRFVVSQKFQETMGFRIFYKYGLEQEHHRTFGLSVLYEP